MSVLVRNENLQVRVHDPFEESVLISRSEC